MNLFRKLATRLVEQGLRVDTFPDHWMCTKAGCPMSEPHVHEERGKDGIWRWRDYGCDKRALNGE